MEFQIDQMICIIIIFLIVSLLAISLEMLKLFLIKKIKKNSLGFDTCEYLKNLQGKQYCKNVKYQKIFEEKHQCKSCKGKSIKQFNINDEDLLSQVKGGKLLAKALNVSHIIVPYLSLLYTIIIAVVSK